MAPSCHLCGEWIRRDQFSIYDGKPHHALCLRPSKVRDYKQFLAEGRRVHHPEPWEGALEQETKKSLIRMARKNKLDEASLFEAWARSGLQEDLRAHIDFLNAQPHRVNMPFAAKVADFFRIVERERRNKMILPTRDLETEPDAVVERVSDIIEAEEAIERLTVREAKVIDLCYIQGFTCAEAAEMTETTEEAVRSIRQRAIEKLRNL